MGLRQKMIMLLTTLLLTTAAVVGALTWAPSRAEADCTCTYGGMQYGVNSCAACGCTSPKEEECVYTDFPLDTKCNWSPACIWPCPPPPA